VNCRRARADQDTKLVAPRFRGNAVDPRCSKLLGYCSRWNQLTGGKSAGVDAINFIDHAPRISDLKDLSVEASTTEFGQW
jgi:hypothetical protein